MGTRITATAALPGLLLAFCCAANAAEPAQAPVTEVTYGGIKVAIDAVTGKLRPMSEAESAALDIAVMSSPAGVAARAAATSKATSTATSRQPVRTINGRGQALRVPKSEMSHVIAVRDASGKVTVQHGDDGSVIINAVAPRATGDVK